MARKLILSLAAASLAFGVAAPAFAKGYHHGHRGHHRHGGHGGGKGAAIALGVIGGAIILNELAEDRARDRYYEDRYYRDRAYESRARDRAYDSGYYDGRADERRYDDRYDDRYESGAYYGDDDGYYGDETYDDTGLAGAGPVDPAPVYRTPDTSYDRAPRAISAAAAYRACLDQARGALGQRGFVISAPYAPDTVEDRGGALLMTATVRAQRGGDSWARAMSCEASENRVYRLELI